MAKQLPEVLAAATVAASGMDQYLEGTFSMVFIILGAIISLASFVASIYILIDAFRDEIWKGIVWIVTCGLYGLYYSLVEFDHEYKWPIVALALLGSLVGGVLMSMGGGPSMFGGSSTGAFP
jgi:uncharacterized membrane protein YhaH (DUF805 family)